MSSSDYEADQETYRFAAIVRLDENDPHPDNDLNEGDVLITEGRCADGTSHSVFVEDDFYDVSCTVLGLFRADTEMSRGDIKRWAARTANQVDFMERTNRDS